MLQTQSIDNNLFFSIINRKKLNVLIADEVKSTITRAISKRSTNVIIDLAGIEFIDSAAFSMLLELNNEISYAGNTLYIANVSLEVNELLSLLKLEHTFKVYSFAPKYQDLLLN